MACLQEMKAIGHIIEWDGAYISNEHKWYKKMTSKWWKMTSYTKVERLPRKLENERFKF